MIPVPEKFDALIIEPDTTNRIRLKQACNAVTTFGKVFQYSTLLDGLRALNEGTKADVVFTAKTCGQDKVGCFIKDAKKTASGQDSAYVLVLPESEASSGVAESMLGGADGLLFAPYSVDRLVEIAQLATRVKRERSVHREEAALKFLLADMLKQIDLLAYAKSCGYDSGLALKNFRQACSVLQAMSPESHEIYYRVAIDVFEAAPLPTLLSERKRYTGASSRIRKKIGEQLATGSSPSSGGGK